jgi:hypothetical protein
MAWGWFAHCDMGGFLVVKKVWGWGCLYYDYYYCYYYDDYVLTYVELVEELVRCTLH